MARSAAGWQHVIPADHSRWLLANVVLPLAAVLVRIRVEEAELGTALGPEYQSYASRTRRLVPGVW